MSRKNKNTAKNNIHKKIRAAASAVRSVMIIDNSPLREKAIFRAHENLQKIAELEKSASQFNDVDLKLYEDWYKLTLGPTVETIHQVQEEFDELADFHNMMVIISKTKKISVPEAYLFLKNEDDQYKNGNEDIRNQIKAAREQRQADLETEIKKTNSKSQSKSQYDDEYDDADDDEYASDDDDDYDDEAAEIEADESEIQKNRTKHKNKIQKLEEMSDKKIIQSMHDFNDGMQFLLEAFSLLLPCSRTDILRRIWKLAPSNQKTAMNKAIKKQFNMTADQMMDQDDQLQQIRRDHFNETYFSKKNKHSPSQDVSESVRIQVKSIYKKIVRKIHPDYLKLDQHPHLKLWFDIIWKKLAEAHRSNDLKKITNLQHKVLIVLKEYDDLGLHDLNLAAESFSEEYVILCAEFENLKNHPAWNFSNLKSYKALESKAKKPLVIQLNQMQKKIKELLADREEIKMIAQLFKENKVRFSKRNLKQNQKPKKRKQVVSKSTQGQMGFGF